MNAILSAIKDRSVTSQQKLHRLAKEAEDSLDVLPLDGKVKDLMAKGVIDDMNEGHAPWRPRYTVPDYARFLELGSEFLGIEPPRDMRDAVDALIVLYHHVPTITNFPVYIGGLDDLLQPFHRDEAETRRCLRTLLLHVDRTLNDSFCHANLGPRDTPVGRIVLELQREMETAVPNMSFKYDPELTGDAMLELACAATMDVAKPAFANHRMFSGEFGDKYAIVSCYNGLSVGGGSCTLSRLNLARLARSSSGWNDLLDRALPDAVDATLSLMDARVRFLLEESGFFESSFLVREGLLDKGKFGAMFGIVGLAEAVNESLGLVAEDARFGRSVAADEAGEGIVARIGELVAAHKAPGLTAFGGRYLLHAQVGLGDDAGVTPGCRIPNGEEPEIHAHIRAAARFHKYFPSGIGDIFAFEPTARRNPAFIADLVKGAFSSGMRYLSFYSSDSDLIRISGYLVKKSEMEKLGKGGQSLQDTTVLGLGAIETLRIGERAVRST